MRLVDLRGASGSVPPEVEVRASEAAELLRLVAVVVGEDDDSDYDVGATRVAEVRGWFGPDLVRRARDVGAGDDRAFFGLSNAAAQLDEPGDVDQLVALLEHDPALPWRLLLSLGTFDQPVSELPVDGRAIAAGDEAAIGALRACCDDPDRATSETLERLLALDPEAHGRAVLDVVREVRRTIWPRLVDEAMPAIERDAAHRRTQLSSGADVGSVVLEATNGYALEDDPRVRRILLLPSFWLRPWIIVDQLAELDTLVLSTPVADTFLALPAEAPPPALLKLSKALADEGRLKLLRRMSTGPVSLGEATDHLGVAKATAHHHLSILRQAGLVVMQGGGRSTRYALRSDAADVAHDALTAYLRPGAPTSPAAGGAGSA